MNNLTTIHPQYPPSLGAIPQSDGSCLFRVWAPKAKSLDLLLTGPEERSVVMESEPHGYFSVSVPGVDVNTTRYLFRLNGNDAWPDPASRFQPEGVHQPSAIPEPDFPWTDQNWRGIPLSDYIVYEMHIGTFSPGGTFDSAIDYLDTLVDLGITAVEVMPVSQFAGGRNWGYDGVYPFAAQSTYGGPDGFKRFVDACHQRGLAVVLDVVYNHLGPEGNYLGKFGRYFTNRYSTPWGAAINFDGRGSDEVRRYFIENALYWVRECHVDALRYDAVHAICDQNARPFLQQLADAVREQGELLNRRIYSIAESNLNNPRMVLPRESGGNGMDAQWVDDLHHALHVELTGEQDGYYADFTGFADLVDCCRDGFVYNGRYSKFREHSHGQPAAHLPASAFVVCSQNHDQVGNRMLGERLTELADFEALKLAAGFVLLSPYIPLLWMGEEYAEPAPFRFFTSHGDDHLIQAVRKGRKAEFKDFDWKGEPPDPQSAETFNACRLDHSLRERDHHAVMLSFYKQLIRLRQTQPALRMPDRSLMKVWDSSANRILTTHRQSECADIVSVFHWGRAAVEGRIPFPDGNWKVVINSAAPRWNGPQEQPVEGAVLSTDKPIPLAPHSVLVLRQESI